MSSHARGRVAANAHPDLMQINTMARVLRGHRLINGPSGRTPNTSSDFTNSWPGRLPSRKPCAGHLSIRRIASRALQREQQEAAHDGEVLVEMRHVGPARGALHVPKIMGKVFNQDEVDDECIGNPASLETGENCKSADQLDR